jgi:Tol biopolymer transport system component
MPDNENKYKPHLITMKSDGSDIRMAIPATLWGDKGGNHPNWCPDGEHVMMNLDIYGEGWRFVQARYDGTDLKTTTEVEGNHGHPSLHPDGKFILTDAYPREDIAWDGDETAPLMIIDLKKNERRRIVRMQTFTKLFEGKGENPKYVRVDLHPAWDSRTHTLVAFNGVADGTRRVFIADLSGIVGK